MTGAHCLQCSTKLPPAAKTGRPRRYCSAACRDDAYRERVADAVIWETLDSNREPVNEETLQAITLQATAADLSARVSAPPEERMVRAVLEARVLAGQFQQLGRLLRNALGLRSEAMGQDIQKALAKHFGDEIAQ